MGFGHWGVGWNRKRLLLATSEGGIQHHNRIKNSSQNGAGKQRLLTLGCVDKNNIC